MRSQVESMHIVARRVRSGRTPGILCMLYLLCFFPVALAETVGKYKSLHREGRSIILSTADGQRLRITPYGNYVIRVQVVRKGEAFFPDDHYEMVESHDWPGYLRVTQGKTSLEISTGKLNLEVTRVPLRVSFLQAGRKIPFLQERDGPVWDGSKIIERFVFDDDEHFTGLGHDYFGRSNGLDLKGQ